MRALDGEQRHPDVDPAALGQRLDKHREVAEVVQCRDVPHVDLARTERALHAPLVAGDDLVLRLAEELLVPRVAQQILRDALQAEEHHPVVEIVEHVGQPDRCGR